MLPGKKEETSKENFASRELFLEMDTDTFPAEAMMDSKDTGNNAD